MTQQLPNMVFAKNKVNILVIRDLEILLNSSFALDQLQIIAKKDSLAIFIASCSEIFGLDIPAEAYKQFYLDAKVKADILNPIILVKKDISQSQGNKNVSSKAAFFSDENTQEIWVTEKAIRDAVDDNDLRGELMTMLIEEYGHYLDYLLRNHYAKTEKDDAPGDEGAIFAYNLYKFNPIEQQDQHFANATIDGESVPFIWDFSELHNNLKKHVNEERQKEEDRSGGLEFYKAGEMGRPGKYGHADVEVEALTPLLLKKKISPTNITKLLDTIYLGNWLRDYSQAVDPMLVRPLSNASDILAATSVDYYSNDNTSLVDTLNDLATNTTLEDLTSNNINENQSSNMTFPTGIERKGWFGLKTTRETTAFHPVMLSVETLTTIVELAAVKEFIHTADQTKEEFQDYQGHLKKLRTDFLPITPETLGPYRPEEHIDNPFGLGQNDKGENKGDKEVYSKFVGYMPDNHDLHKINKDFGMKNYIRSMNSYQVEGAPYPTAYEFIVGKLKDAATGGLDNAKSLVDFGAAMHTLEDYFAHTNYTEICIIKSVEPFVFPWVDEVDHKDGNFIYDYSQLVEGKGFDDRYIILNDINNIHIGPNQANRIASYIPIVTGTFGSIDTAASILPVINHALFDLEIKPWEKSEPGKRTFADILIMEVLKDLDKAQDKDSTGTSDNSYTENFQTYLSIRDNLGKVADFLIPDFVEESFHWIIQRIGLMLKFTQHFIIKTVASNLNDAQTLLNKDLDAMELGTFRIGINPSHSQIAKDDLEAPMHQLSAQLAVEAIRRVGEKMLDIWDGSGSVVDAVLVVDNIMRHPVTSQWQDSIVDEWAKNNCDKITQACSPSAIIDRTFHALDEMDESLELIDQYINDPKTINIMEKVDTFFANDDPKSSESGYIKDFVISTRDTAKAQRKRAEALKVIWDKKYPKSSTCQTSVKNPSNPSVSGTEKTAEDDKFSTYLIQYGDTLTKIAAQNNTSVKMLQELNGLSDDKIYAGKHLKIPSPNPNTN